MLHAVIQTLQLHNVHSEPCQSPRAASDRTWRSAQNMAQGWTEGVNPCHAVPTVVEHRTWTDGE